MTDGNAQIVAAYEVCNLTPEEISREYGYDLTAVKMVLTQCSRQFVNQFCGRDASKEEDKEADALFTKEDMRNAADVYRTLSREAESEVVRLKASEFIINERKGRNDVKVIQNAPKVNIVMINEQIIRAREMVMRDRERVAALKSANPARELQAA